MNSDLVIHTQIQLRTANENELRFSYPHSPVWDLFMFRTSGHSSLEIRGNRAVISARAKSVDVTSL